MGKKYEVQIKNNTKWSLSFSSSLTWWVVVEKDKPVYKQKFHTTWKVTSVETNSLAIDNGRIFANFKSKFEWKTLDLQKKFMTDNLINKEVTVYYDELKDKVIAKWNVVILYSGMNLVDYLYDKKWDFENAGKKFVEVVNYISKKSEQNFDLIKLETGKLQVDYTLIGEKWSKCTAKLFREWGKLAATLIDINGPTTSGRKTPIVDEGKYYVSLVTKNSTCNISLKQLK